MAVATEHPHIEQIITDALPEAVGQRYGCEAGKDGPITFKGR